MRLDDHPGLAAALRSGAPVLPLFCFDPARAGALARQPGGARALASALASLRAALRAQGSDLAFRVGPWEEAVPQAAAELGASLVLAEAEVESEGRRGAEAVRAALPAGARLESWSAPLFVAHRDSFRGENCFCSARGGACFAGLDMRAAIGVTDCIGWPRHPLAAEVVASGAGVNAPLDAPAALPRLPPGCAGAEGALPSGSELLRMAAAAYAGSLDPRLAAAAAVDPSGETSSDDEAGAMAAGSSGGGDGGMEAADWLIGRLTGGSEEEGGGGSSAWEAELSAELAAGEGPVMAALEQYLR